MVSLHLVDIIKYQLQLSEIEVTGRKRTQWMIGWTQLYLLKTQDTGKTEAETQETHRGTQQGNYDNDTTRSRHRLQT